MPKGGKRFGDRRGEKFDYGAYMDEPGHRTPGGSVNPNGLSGHKRAGSVTPNAGWSPTLIPPVMKKPRINPGPGPRQPRWDQHRTGRQRPTKGTRAGPSTY